MKKPPGGGAGGWVRGCFGSSGVRPQVQFFSVLNSYTRSVTLSSTICRVY